MDNRSLKLSFFWHMHQPDYRGSDGVMKMPWVFLHAIKDYYEMPWLLSRYKGLKASFNISASLIEQLNLYRDPLINDHFLSIWALHPSQLDKKSKSWLIKTCKSTQYETMIRPMPRFDALYRQEEYSDEELIDLEVLFILAWCGNYLRQENYLVREMIKREQGFSQAEKLDLLATLCRFIETILPFYASLRDRGVISLSTTPYNHPILPLLIDIGNARRANVHTVLPDNPLSLEEDAIEHVKRSINLYEQTFGAKPTGLWPAEGAVDEESIAIYKRYGIKWIATDESILFRSLESEERSLLYRPYRFDDVTIGFRDHALSDLIGFTYRFKPAQEAVAHFMHALEHIAAENPDATVFVILDGENAWEYFEKNGYAFLTGLYHRFCITPWCKTVTMDEIAHSGNSADLEKIAPGSWINDSFDTWAGHSEKNRAWELIYQTRRDVDNYLGSISQETAEKIRYHFLASECSDWFWWYGDDHMTEFASEFDALFREHLTNIYRLLEMQPPLDLYEPIMSHKSIASFLLKPQGPITPLINGNNHSFFDWLGCGSIDERKLFSTMERAKGPVDIIYYGNDEAYIYLALEGQTAAFHRSDMKLEIIIEETGEHLSFAAAQPHGNHSDVFAIGERIEVALSRLHFKAYNSVHLRFEIVEGNRIIQTMPGNGALFVNIDEQQYANNWFV